ncbi:MULTISPECIES: MtnX-like HAD-IB family phosphatase [Pelosinus]|uniref:2,3-diketo-5-methylthio-1-phosphopentane phosphatase n=1 Tax=Pelosinus fermentans B4 TaxID=1149862 RepID=I9LG57_9FIRM|nr:MULTISPECIES: MtnX-like HAD-IB family phosphatase [Pelosinus]EIW19326.1 2,3-diketo-5-methylthio-1-phosphopentane phosphatase [Pelosinus fermentans B4]EIW24943.1 2,3-diketo-5-methylthio-1-phosphopentane phosphatase [Pelosinus fermentans A11]
MKEFIFVSDFDGTMSERDFYHIIMEKYLGQWGKELHASWKRNEMEDVEFLSTVFKSINRTEEEICEDILSIKIDEYIPAFIEYIKSAGGDFLILSAGTRYYIERLLAFKGIQEIEIISNEGKYENKGVTLLPPDTYHPFYSRRHGVDKAKVVQSLKQKYKKVYYAGNSRPDVNAALLADIAFAKGKLITLLQAKAAEHVPFECFFQVEEFLKNRELI